MADKGNNGNGKGKRGTGRKKYLKSKRRATIETIKRCSP